ncbi:M55 family metallopeptidase, partial [Acinetobacter baumannii]|nr:M55 family metallopeptidase [Acinetobacter baumannii]
KDAHEDGRNIIYDMLPDIPSIKLIRGWTEDPLCMMSCIDESFDACAFVGYHSGACSDGNPLSHTMYLKFDYIKLNGEFVSEF